MPWGAHVSQKREKRGEQTRTQLAGRRRAWPRQLNLPKRNSYVVHSRPRFEIFTEGYSPDNVGSSTYNLGAGSAQKNKQAMRE